MSEHLAAGEPTDVARAEAALAAGNVAKAIEIFGHACASGDQHACARQGFYLIRDTHDPARVALAVRLWTTACDRADDALACANLGAFYADGEGVPKDDKRAALLEAKACDRSDNFACGLLATDYWNGQGVERDLTRAFRLADKGCRLGSPFACTLLGIGWTEGWSGSKDLRRAADLFRKSCDQDSFSGCFQLGLAMRSGRGMPSDPEQARRLLEKACRLGAPKDSCDRELRVPHAAH